MQSASGLIVLLILMATTLVSADKNNGLIVIKSSKSRLPASFLSVLNDLEKTAMVSMGQKSVEDTSTTSEDGNQGKEEPVSEESKSDVSSKWSTLAACLISSRTLTRSERHQVRQVLLGLSAEEESPASDSTSSANGDSSTDNETSENKSDQPELSSLVNGVDAHVKAVGCYFDNRNNQQVVCLVMPDSLAELAACVIATKGNLVYAPSAMDLARGEGLLELLGPAMELVLASGHSAQAKLTIILPPQAADDLALAQQQLIDAVEPLLSQLVMAPSAKTVATLSQVFQRGVDFVNLEQAASSVWSRADDGSDVGVVKDPVVLTRAAYGMPSRGVVSSSSPQDVAAGRLLLLKAKSIVEQCLETVRRAVRQEDGGEEDGESIKLIPAFGELCTAEIHSAMSQFQQACRAYAKSVASSRTAVEIKDQMLDEMNAQLQSMAWKQIELLFRDAFQDFRLSLAKVERILGPNLPQEMSKTIQQCVRDFTKAAKRLTNNDATVVVPAVSEFQRTCQEFVDDRLLELRANNKFKPLPRKGFTVGFHWLLPKPFGNDYRQEPWMVHATDNMVYIPKSSSKLSDVAKESVTRGDWRSQVVPSPVGNDFIYSQQ